jgi:hypothetical protein
VTTSQTSLSGAGAVTRATVPARPFADWLNARTQRYATLGAMAETFGVDERTLYRYRNCLATGPDGEEPTETFSLVVVEEALHRAGFFLWDVYDEEEHFESHRDENLKPLAALMQEGALVRAKAMYDTGHSMRETADALFPGSGYASIHSLTWALYREFRNQGWQVRTRAEAGVLALRPRGTCEAVVGGDPCNGYAKTGSRFCRFHQPSVTLFANGRVSEGLPLAPFAAWLRTRIQEAGSVKEVGLRAGVDSAQVGRWANEYMIDRRRGRRKAQFIQQRSVERVLRAWDDGTTLDDLYPEKVAA